jgi:DNA-binding NtrC family response regulator
MVKRHILSISYDSALLTTRQWILEKAGYDVSSALGFAEALEVSARHDFDLVVMGHSMPQKDKIALFDAIHAKCSASLLSILRHGDTPIPQASYTVDGNDGPEALLEAVKRALE